MSGVSPNFAKVTTFEVLLSVRSGISWKEIVTFSSNFMTCQGILEHIIMVIVHSWVKIWRVTRFRSVSHILGRAITAFCIFIIE